NGNASPIGPRSDAAAQALEAVSARLQVAQDGHRLLVEQHAQARELLAAAIIAVDHAALAVGIDRAVAEAEAIEQQAAELNRRRSGLWSLSAAITNEQRRLGPQAHQLYLPAVVSRAVGAIDARPDPSWDTKLK